MQPDHLLLSTPGTCQLQLVWHNGLIDVVGEAQVGRRLDDDIIIFACKLGILSLRQYRCVTQVDERSNRLRWIRSGVAVQAQYIEAEAEIMLNLHSVWEQMLLQGVTAKGRR